MRHYGVALALVICAAPASARAQSPQDKAAATTLFDEGKQLMAQGQYQKACAKFEASHALVPGIGKRLNLADCYEKLGKLASAWAIFRESVGAAGKAGDAGREKYARDRVAALEPRLGRITIALAAGAEVGGLTVTRDGTAVPAALFDQPVPVDAGAHRVQASAPGRATWSTEVTVTDGRIVSVEVPLLQEAEVREEAVPAPPAAETAETAVPVVVDQPARGGGRGRRMAGIVVGGVGLAGLGVGSYFGLSAKSKWDDAQDHCNAEVECDPTGVALVDDARAAGNLSTIAFAVGAAGVVAGLVLILTAPSDPPEATTQVGVVPAPAGGVLVLSGRF